MLVRPPGTVVPDGLLFYRRCFLGRPEKKNLGELWSTNRKVLMAHNNQPKWTLFWRLHFGHYAVLPSQIFTRVTH